MAILIHKVNDTFLHEIVLRKRKYNRIRPSIGRIGTTQVGKNLFQFRLALGIEPGVLPGCTRSAFRIIDGLDMDPAISQY